jgi:type IV pilus assembly protein PilM
MPIKQAATVSVDIGHSNLKLTQTSADGRIQKFVVHRIPEGCVDDLNIVSEDALIKSLKTARQKAHLNAGKCFLVLSGSDILIRHFTLPILSEDELYQNILNEMSGYLPVDPEKYYIDYKIAEKVKEDGVEMYNVLVTTVHKRIVNRYRHVLGAAGFHLSVVDTCENAREKLLKNLAAHDKSFNINGGICILDLGTRCTRASIYHNGNFFISNVIKKSGQQLTEVIAQNSGKDILSSETMKREVDFLNQPHKNAELKSAVTYEIDALLYEIARLFDYYRNRAKNTVHAVFLSGGGALMPGLVEYVGRHLGLPVYLSSMLLPVSRSEGATDHRGFTLLLNAYAATLRED